MKDWEFRYLHEKAVRDSLLAMHDMKPPEGEKYGTLTKAPEICYLKFNGAKFWKALETSKHTSPVYEKCSCYKGN